MPIKITITCDNPRCKSGQEATYTDLSASNSIDRQVNGLIDVKHSGFVNHIGYSTELLLCERCHDDVTAPKTHYVDII